MDNETRIENQMLRSRLLMAQNEIAHKDCLLRDCVSRTEFDAMVAERDMYMKLYGQTEEELARSKAHEDELNQRIGQLERENSELKDTVSCKMNGLNFGDYIEYVMERMQAGETDARSLLPNHIVIPQDWVPEGQIDRPRQEKIA